MRKYLLGAALLSMFAVSCNPDKDLVKATVIDSGDIAKNGCGYLLRLENGTEFKPNYIPSAYQSHARRSALSCAVSCIPFCNSGSSEGVTCTPLA